MQRVLIVGAGQGGSALLETLLKTNMIQIIAIADLDLEAPGMVEAKKNGIDTTTDWKEYIKDDIDIIIETTGSSAVLKELIEKARARSHCSKFNGLRDIRINVRKTAADPNIKGTNL